MSQAEVKQLLEQVFVTFPELKSREALQKMGFPKRAVRVLCAQLGREAFSGAEDWLLEISTACLLCNLQYVAMILKWISHDLSLFSRTLGASGHFLHVLFMFPFANLEFLQGLTLENMFKITTFHRLSEENWPETLWSFLDEQAWLEVRANLLEALSTKRPPTKESLFDVKTPWGLAMRGFLGSKHVRFNASGLAMCNVLGLSELPVMWRAAQALRRSEAEAGVVTWMILSS